MYEEYQEELRECHVTFRVEKSLKEKLESEARLRHRSVSDLMRLILIEHYGNLDSDFKEWGN